MKKVLRTNYLKAIYEAAKNRGELNESEVTGYGIAFASASANLLSKLKKDKDIKISIDKNNFVIIMIKDFSKVLNVLSTLNEQGFFNQTNLQSNSKQIVKLFAVSNSKLNDSLGD